MTDIATTERHPRNIAGPWLTDDTCIDCDMCRTIAPTIFRRCDEEGTTYVWRQPETAEELALAEEARSSCPTETIHRAAEA